jgi:hypothetical protein
MAGPFAFLDPSPNLAPIRIVTAGICVGAWLIHLVVRKQWSSALAILGVCVWFLVGCCITYLGV